MLILPVTEVNFQAYADNIAGDFFGNGTPLTDGIVKVAKDMDFTPEEVKRLVEKTNTAASLHLLKSASDRKATFTLAKLEQVLQRVFPADEEPLAKTASVYTGIPVTRTAAKNFIKAAAEEPARQPAACSDIDGFAALSTVNRELDDRRLEKIARECAVQDKIDSLCQLFIKRDISQFHKFASECAAIYGEKCFPVLGGIAGYLRVPLNKTAAAGLVDDTSSEFGMVREICDGLGRIIKLGEEIGHLEKLANGIWEGAKKTVRV